LKCNQVDVGIQFNAPETIDSQSQFFSGDSLSHRQHSAVQRMCMHFMRDEKTLIHKSGESKEKEWKSLRVERCLLSAHFGRV